MFFLGKIMKKLFMILFVAIFLVPVLAGIFLPLTNRKEKPIKFIPLKKLYAFLDLPLISI